MWWCVHICTHTQVRLFIFTMTVLFFKDLTIQFNDFHLLQSYLKLLFTGALYVLQNHVFQLVEDIKPKLTKLIMFVIFTIRKGQYLPLLIIQKYY